MWLVSREQSEVRKYLYRGQQGGVCMDACGRIRELLLITESRLTRQSIGSLNTVLDSLAGDNEIAVSVKLKKLHVIFRPNSRSLYTFPFYELRQPKFGAKGKRQIASTINLSVLQSIVESVFVYYQCQSLVVTYIPLSNAFSAFVQNTFVVKISVGLLNFWRVKSNANCSTISNTFLIQKMDIE